jgi:polar amino acid transport system permease protein
MNYTLQYDQVWPYIPFLIDGALLSLQIAFLAFCGGLLLGTVFASLKTFGGKVINRVIDGYVTFFMNTPQLVQIYFLYFALPDVGILLSSYMAVLIGMTLNAGAYLTEIQRAGFESVRKTEMEAAEVLGFSRAQQVRGT